MQLKDLIGRGDLQIKTKIKSEGERFIVGFKLDLSKEELAMLGLGAPRKGRGKEVAKQPSLRETVESLTELVIKGFEQVNNQFEQVNNRLQNIEQDVALMKSTPTMKKEIEQVQTKDRTR